MKKYIVALLSYNGDMAFHEYDNFESAFIRFSTEISLSTYDRYQEDIGNEFMDLFIYENENCTSIVQCNLVTHKIFFDEGAKCDY